MKYIYILYTCDEWKSNASMNAVLATTSIRKVHKRIKELVKNKDINVGNDNLFGYLMSGNLPPKLFANEMNNILDYGYLEVWED